MGKTNKVLLRQMSCKCVARFGIIERDVQMHLFFCKWDILFFFFNSDLNLMRSQTIVHGFEAGFILTPNKKAQNY